MNMQSSGNRNGNSRAMLQVQQFELFPLSTNSLLKSVRASCNARAIDTSVVVGMNVSSTNRSIFAAHQFVPSSFQKEVSACDGVFCFQCHNNKALPFNTSHHYCVLSSDWFCAYRRYFTTCCAPGALSGWLKMSMATRTTLLRTELVVKWRQNAERAKQLKGRDFPCIHV